MSDAAEPYTKWYKDDLISEAADRGLDVTGNKDDLIARLEASDTVQANYDAAAADVTPAESAPVETPPVEPIADVEPAGADVAPDEVADAPVDDAAPIAGQDYIPPDDSPEPLESSVSTSASLTFRSTAPLTVVESTSGHPVQDAALFGGVSTS